MIRNLMYLLILLLPFATSAQKGLKNSKQFLSIIDQRIPQLLEDFSVPGAAIAIIENGEIVLQKGYGFSNIEKEVMVSTKTGFNVASISKTITAWGIMKLVQEKKIDLDFPVENYLTRWHLPESEFSVNGVTIRRLLSHTAGLSLHGYPGWSPKDTLPTIEESLNGKNNGPAGVEIIMKPGTKYQYSGGGFTILQLIIEEVSGQKFEDYIQTQVLDPLGMINSSFKIDERILAASASEYDDFGELIDFELFTAQAAAGLHTNIEDFTRFALANMHQSKLQKTYNTVLTNEVVKQMMLPETATKGVYGLGYEVDTRAVLKGLIGHSGDNSGWHSIFRVNPETNNGLVVFTNGGLGYNIINAVLCDWVAWQTSEHLWDGCDLKKPISNKLKQIIDDNGIGDITETYAQLKEKNANDYNFSVNQLNNLGYYYMERKEYDKATTIFKINAAAFPSDYNVYDSYGEALLALGFREAAIKNYKKSVKINPANGNGVKILNELGISNMDIIKDISFVVGAKILADYVGRYKTSAGEFLAINKNEDYLTVEIQDQQLSLSAESIARFQALGEESIVSFFTAATGQKGLWLKEKIWTKISDTVKNETDTIDSTLKPFEKLRSVGEFLVFRNNPSWDRQTDFENVLDEIGCKYEQSESSTMASRDLSIYDVIIIPGRQSKEFYNDYVKNAKRFNEFVSNGGTLLLELNGAESSSIILPLDVNLVPNKGFENAILESEHPIFFPLMGKSIIHARYTSSAYLQNIPNKAIVLAIEAEGGEVYTDRPTFIEYPCGKGLVIAACQCFHDEDGSGRGPLMVSAISYALNRSWAAQK